MHYRWVAKVTYRHDDGPRTTEYPLEEIQDLHDVIEGGPHWDTIDIVRINHITSPTLTVEQAEKL